MAQRTTPPKPLASAQWKEPVANPAALPTDGNVQGDIREVLDDGDGNAAIYQWGGSSWVKIADPDSTGGALESLTVDSTTLVANLAGYEDRVGIGVNDPDHTLELAGILHVSGEVASPAVPAAADGGLLYVKTDGSLYYASDAVAEIDISHSGGTGTVTSLDLSSDSGSTSAVTTSGTFTISGGTNVSTSAAGTAVTINSTDQFTGTVTSVDLSSDSGSTSAITTSGTLTIAGGTNVATTATGTTVTIDSTDQYTGTVTSLDLASDSGSTSAITTSGTLTIAGTANEVETSATGTTVTVGLPSAVAITSTLTTGDTVTASKDVNGDFTAITLVNNDPTTSSADAKIGIQFNMNDDDDDKNLPAGKIQVLKEQAWDTNDATHDSSIRFEVANGGVQQEGMTLDSSGQLSTVGNLVVGSGNIASSAGGNHIVISGGNTAFSGAIKVSGNSVTDAGAQKIIASNGSGTIDIGQSGLPTTMNGPTIHSQGIVQAFTQITATGPTALSSSHTWVDANPFSNAVSLTLPAASTAGAGFLLYIQDFNQNATGTNKITITADGSDTIGGVASKEITLAGGKLYIISNGSSAWGVIEEILS